MILSSMQYPFFAGAKAPVPAYYPSGSEALASLTPDTAGMDARYSEVSKQGSGVYRAVFTATFQFVGILSIRFSGMSYVSTISPVCAPVRILNM
ncbi:MAG TPA: hypothetical protein ENJ08_11420 [Gammaproteobacteria bacterium]|nr:hypothetical protein [Gammaproteobacteria bacterium]